MFFESVMLVSVYVRFCFFACVSVCVCASYSVPLLLTTYFIILYIFHLYSSHSQQSNFQPADLEEEKQTLPLMLAELLDDPYFFLPEVCVCEKAI